MIIDSSVIESEGARYRVIVHEEIESINDPRDWWEGASDIDVAMWRDDLWSYVWVQVIKLHTCPGCDVEHETDRSESLGMVAFGIGDGWKVGMAEIVAEHPVPDLIEEIMGGHDITGDATCGKPWVAEIELCPRCGKDAGAHAHIVVTEE